MQTFGLDMPKTSSCSMQPCHLIPSRFVNQTITMMPFSLFQYAHYYETIHDTDYNIPGEKVAEELRHMKGEWNNNTSHMKRRISKEYFIVQRNSQTT